MHDDLTQAASLEHKPQHATAAGCRGKRREISQVGSLFGHPASDRNVAEGGSGRLVEHSHDQTVFEDELNIKPCAADPEPHDDADLDGGPDKPASRSSVSTLCRCS
ncbi:hypothetical protein [Bradyrhizobium tunisiense]|uniref:hypothetical protein n=1 Tax=Bradyrhizobium tunisiense TaxID=3278709 RepID=UPI0035E31498